MKLLNCLYCHDLKAVVPEIRVCWCGKSKAIYDKEINKEVYSGPAILWGIKDKDVIYIRENLDASGFTKGEWFVIKPDALTIIKVKNAATYKISHVKRRLTARNRRRTMPIGLPADSGNN